MLDQLEMVKTRQKQALLLGKVNELEAMLTGAKNDPTAAASGPYGHGTNGLFNIPGTDPRVFGAMMYPDTSSLADIPVATSPLGQEGNEFGGVDQYSMPILTGVTAGALDNPNNQPTGDCAVGPEGGLTKIGTVANIYARYRGSTRPVSIVRSGMRSSTLDPITLRLMNMPDANNRWMPKLPAAANILMNELARRVFETVISFQRMFSREIWIGNPANNSGQRRFLWGLNYQLNTGTHIDMWSGATLTAANPFIHNFGYQRIDGSANIVKYLEEADRHVMYRAERHRLLPFRYKLRMRPDMFFGVTAVWPIKAYFDAFEQINNFTNGRVVVNASDAYNIRQELRATRVLPINGKFVEVVLDDAMSEQNPTNQAELTLPGTFASSIVGTPETIMGGIPALFFDNYNHNNDNSGLIAQFAGSVATFTTDGGLFRWYVNFQNGCLQLTFDVLPRLNMIASQLGFVVSNVAYAPIQHLNEAFPDSSYFADGGNTYQVTPSQFYTGWGGSSTPSTLGWTW